MKKKWKIISAILASVTLVGFGLNLLLIDGIQGALWGSMFREDTEYADGYTDKGWRTVATGMTVKQVHDAIGEPWDSWSNRDESVVMRWSRSPGDTHYRCRVLTFTNGTVSNKNEEFWVD